MRSGFSDSLEARHNANGHRYLLALLDHLDSSEKNGTLTKSRILRIQLKNN
jgi:hypothetical protein